MTKSSSSTTNLPSQRTSKRSLSPIIVTSSEKRRRAREQKRQDPSSSSTNIIIRIDDGDDDDIEQENDDDEDDHDDDDVVPIKYDSSKQRQASSGSIEYVQMLNNDQQLNNIENIKSKSKINDEEIIICRSPPSVKKVLPSSPNKTPSKSNGARKSNVQQVCCIREDLFFLSCFSRSLLMMNMFEFVVKFVVKFSKVEVDFPNM